MTVHTGDKVYKCYVCNRSFGFQSTLSDNLKTHTADRCHLCGHCNKGFTTRGCLTSHMSQLRAGGPVIPGLLCPAGVEHSRNTRWVVMATRFTTVMNTISILWAGMHKPHQKVAGLVLSVLVITSS